MENTQGNIPESQERDGRAEVDMAGNTWNAEELYIT
jgi:hypothetical protein